MNPQIRSITDLLSRRSLSVFEPGTCHVESAVLLIGGKWRMLILRALLFKNQLRYNELLREIPKISSKELTRNLRALEEHGLVARTGESLAQHVVYEVTEIGSELGPIFKRLGDWASRYGAATP